MWVRVRVKVITLHFQHISVYRRGQFYSPAEETGIPGENHRPVASHWQTLSHNVSLSTRRHERGSILQLLWWYTLIAQVVVNPTNHTLTTTSCYTCDNVSWDLKEPDDVTVLIGNVIWCLTSHWQIIFSIRVIRLINGKCISKNVDIVWLCAYLLKVISETRLRLSSYYVFLE